MCSSRSFRSPKSLTNYYCDTEHGFIRSNPPSSPTPPPSPKLCECGGYCPGEKPYTAEELRRIKDIIDKNREAIEERKVHLEWCERCNDAAEEQYLNEIKEAQKQIKEHVARKKQKEETEWVFEKSANGWI